LLSDGEAEYIVTFLMTDVVESTDGEQSAVYIEE